MEEETEEQGENTKSGTTSTQVDTQDENCTENSNEPPDVQEPGEDNHAEGGDCDGEVEPSQVGKDLCISDAETLPQETLIATKTQDNADCLPLSPMLTEEEVTPSISVLSPSNTQNHPCGPCWYCLRSLESEYRPETPKQEDSDPLSPQPSSGQKVSYQTDPRPHFGVAWSSHSTSHPLWGSEGPCWGKRNEQVLEQTQPCPHCHLDMALDTLRWHEAKCLLFEELRNSKK